MTLQHIWLKQVWPCITELSMKRTCKDPPGGAIQKLQWSRARSSAPTNSALARLLLVSWGFGFISTPFLQQIAAAAVQDGARGDGLQMLANLGAPAATPEIWFLNCGST